MDCIPGIHTCLKGPQYSTQFCLTKVAIVALTILGISGIYLLSSNQMIPLGITGIILSGLGILGLITYFFSNRVEGKGPAKAPLQITPKNSMQQHQPNSSSTSSPLFSQTNATPQQIAQKSLPNPQALQVKTQIDNTLLGFDPALSNYEEKKKKIIEITKKLGAGNLIGISQICKIFRTFSYEEVKECFIGLQEIDPVWSDARLSGANAIRLALIEIYKNDEKWLAALLDGIKTEKEKVQLFQDKINERKITNDDPLFKILRDRKEFIVIIKSFDRSSLNLKLEAFSDEDYSSIVTTLLKLEPQNEALLETLDDIFYKLADTVWKQQDFILNQGNIDEQKIKEAWDRFEKCLKLLNDYADEKRCAKIFGLVFQAWTDNTSRWFRSPKQKDEGLKAVESHLARFNSLIDLYFHEEKKSAIEKHFEEDLWERINKVGTKVFIPLLIAVKKELWNSAELQEEKKALFIRIAKRMTDESIDLLANRLKNQELTWLLEYWGLCDLHAGKPFEHPHHLVLLALICAALPKEKQEVYFYDFTTVLNTDGIPTLYRIAFRLTQTMS